MKKTLIGSVCLALIAGLALLGTIGCKTVVTTNPDGTTQTNQVANSAVIIPIIEGVVPVAVQIAVSKETNSVVYFRATTVVLDTLVSNGVYDPAAVASAIDSIKITDKDTKLAVDAAVQTGLALYKSFAADAVTAQLNKADILSVLQAFSDSIKRGLAFSASPADGKTIVVTSVGKKFKVRVQ